MLGQHLLREGLGLKKSNTERATKIAIIVPQIKPREEAISVTILHNISNIAQKKKQIFVNVFNKLKNHAFLLLTWRHR